MNPARRALPALVAASVLAAATEAALRGIPDWERRVYARINDLPDALAPLVWPPMQFGSFSSPFVVGAAIYWRQRRAGPTASLIAGGVGAWLAAKGVKKLVGRGRPYDFDSTTNLRLWTEVDGSLGFVSGHAAVGAATAHVLSRHVSSPIAATAYALAAIAGLSRIYAGAHLPIDVIGGTALGVLIAEAVRALGPNDPGRTWVRLPDSN